MDVIKGGDLFDVRLTDLGKDLLLLFSELLWVYNRLYLDRCLYGSCLNRLGVLLLFISLPLEFSELPEFFIFLSLLLRVDI